MKTAGQTIKQYGKFWAEDKHDRWNPKIASEEVPVRQLWGIKEILGTLILFLFMQLAVIIVFTAIAAAQDYSGFRATDDQGAFIAEKLGEITSNYAMIFTSSIAMYAAWIIGMKASSETKGLGNFWADFKIRFRWIDLPLGIGLAIAFRLLEQGVMWVLLNMTSLDMGGAGNSEIVTSMSGVWWFLNAVLVASFLAPVMEEFFFRGFMLEGIKNSLLRVKKLSKGRTTRAQGLRLMYSDATVSAVEYKVESFVIKLENSIEKYATVIAIIASSIFFGFMHFQGTETFGQWFVVIWTGFLGFMMALMAVKTNRLGLAIAFHVSYNFSGILLVKLFGM